jgi:hypothetical protein
MKLETFLTLLYVYVDDWYKAYIEPRMEKRQAGAAQQLSDSEVLTLALAGQWRVGVPWQSERGLVRWMQAHGRGMFPKMIGRSAFNARVRWLWGAFIYLQEALVEQMDNVENLYECVDCLSLPAHSNGQHVREKEHWLWESTRAVGGTSGGFYVGDTVLMSVLPDGVITGWLVGSANVDDRWLLEAFLTARVGQPCLVGPAPSTHAAYAERAIPPVAHVGPFQAVGQIRTATYLTDGGFWSWRWLKHWHAAYQAHVIAPSPRNAVRSWSAHSRRWFSSKRQVVETVFAVLTDVFGFRHLAAHSRWGQYTRLAAKCAAFNIGLFLNRLLGRPPFALATLIT